MAQERRPDAARMEGDNTEIDPEQKGEGAVDPLAMGHAEKRRRGQDGDHPREPCLQRPEGEASKQKLFANAGQQPKRQESPGSVASERLDFIIDDGEVALGAEGRCSAQREVDRAREEEEPQDDHEELDRAPRKTHEAEVLRDRPTTE